MVPSCKQRRACDAREPVPPRRASAPCMARQRRRGRRRARVPHPLRPPESEHAMKTKYLVAAKNTEGRICCWAQGEDPAVVKKSVDERWPTHGGSGNGCYPGEKRGPD